MRREAAARAKGSSCKRIRGKDTKASVLCADTENPDGTLHTLHTQPEMIRAMKDSNLLRQQQCHGTPSMTEPFLSDFGYLANTPAADAVPAGTYQPPADLDTGTKEFLTCLKRPDELLVLGPIDATVTPEQNRDAWQRQDERKGSEPSTPGFAHCKAASLLPALNNIDTLMRNIPLVCGFSPISWRTVTDVEIFKKPDVRLADKMRLMQLFDPQFQINDKNIGQICLAHAEKAGAVSPFQHGSRKRHKAINTCRNKLLLCNVSRQT